jgi:prevent-host-death family protein
MATIPQKELRNHVGEVLRRAESGERLTVTVAGRPVAELGPVPRRRFISAAELDAIFAPPAPKAMLDDLRRMPGGLGDPFA